MKQFFYNLLKFTLIILFINNCSENVSSNNTNKFVIDATDIQISIEKGDSLYSYKIVHKIYFHTENSGANLVSYGYRVEHGTHTTGYDWNAARSRPRSTMFIEESQNDSLIYDRSYTTPLNNNTDKYILFYISGYFFNEPLALRNIQQDLDLEGFFYSSYDTLKFIE